MYLLRVKNWLKEKLGRTSIHTPESRLIKEVIKKELYLPAVQRSNIGVVKRILRKYGIKDTV